MASMQVIDHLKNLAKNGNRIILCVIHSPNSQILSLFDDMYFVSNGKCFYSGPLDDMVPTFTNHGLECPNFYNRADYGR
jgi:ABC-type multidrug transport system ATPase subunit